MIQKAVISANIYHEDLRQTGILGFRSSNSSKYPKDSSKKLLYEKMQPIIPEAENQISEKKEHQQQLIESNENPKKREMITTP